MCRHRTVMTCLHSPPFYAAVGMRLTPICTVASHTTKVSWRCCSILSALACLCHRIPSNMQLLAGANCLHGLIQQALQDVRSSIGSQSRATLPPAPLQAASQLLLISHMVVGASPAWQPPGITPASSHGEAGLPCLMLALPSTQHVVCLRVGSSGEIRFCIELTRAADQHTRLESELASDRRACSGCAAPCTAAPRPQLRLSRNPATVHQHEYLQMTCLALWLSLRRPCPLRCGTCPCPALHKQTAARHLLRIYLSRCSLPSCFYCFLCLLDSILLLLVSK